MTGPSSHVLHLNSLIINLSTHPAYATNFAKASAGRRLIDLFFCISCVLFIQTTQYVVVKKYFFIFDIADKCPYLNG